MSELDTSGSVEGLGRATSPVYSTTLEKGSFVGAIAQDYAGYPAGTIGIYSAKSWV
jgi:hypothetical protein